MIVHMVFKNSDMIEGRGPMIPDLCFLHKPHAEEYIDAQPGIMGRKGKWSTDPYGDWKVREIEVIEHSLLDEERKKKDLKERALAKLTKEEREILNIN